ncbi:MAG TPA: hypothetical protein VGG99_24640 [Acetobacteraceae bacterium]|jgi:hypothetical protein
MPFARGRSGPGSRQQARQFLFLVLPAAATTVALWLVPLHWQRSVFPPADKIVSGPLYGGALIMAPPFVAFFYIVLAACYSAMVQRRLSGPPGILPVERGFALLTFVVLGCTTLVYAHGISAYWFATSSGITVQSGWLAAPYSYAWSAATQRRISCYRSRSGRNVSFQVKFRDGRTIDLADTQQMDFENHFVQLSALTASALIVEYPSHPSQYCPGFMLRFLTTHQSRPLGEPGAVATTR